MTADHPSPGKAGSDSSVEERLERGEVIYYPVCPFPLPEGDDRLFLHAQQLASRAHKNISYDPATGRAAGFLRTAPRAGGSSAAGARRRSPRP